MTEPNGDTPQGEEQPTSIPTTMPDGSVVNIDPTTVWGLGKTFSQYNADQVQPSLKHVSENFGVDAATSTHDGSQAFGTFWWDVMADSDVPANHALKMEQAVKALDAFVETNRSLANICSTVSAEFPDADDLNAMSLEELEKMGINVEKPQTGGGGGMQAI